MKADFNEYSNRLWAENGTVLTTLIGEADEAKYLTKFVSDWAEEFISDNNLTLSFEAVEQLFLLMITVLVKLKSQEELTHRRTKVATENSKIAGGKGDFSIQRMADHVANLVAVAITESKEPSGKRTADSNAS